MSIGNVSYADKIPPTAYRCNGCEKHGCKLWRKFASFEDIMILCCDCAAKQQGEDVADIDNDGKVDTGEGYRIDQIGCFVPAIPMEDGSTFWGYTSVPPDGCVWWRRLPTRV